jgi:membrane protease YdiL (CAAX protease family)/uncharacterized RDD family membrane protein YckC
VTAEAQEARAELDYVGFWRRLLAAFLDNVVWFVYYAWFYGGLVGAVYDSGSPEAAGILVLVYLSLWFNYFAFCEWRWGQTIGKNATGIEVRSLDGAEKLSFGQASIRGLLRIVDFFVIGWIMVGVTKRKQRLGDKAAKTVVVRRPPRGIPGKVRAGAGATATANPGAAATTSSHPGTASPPSSTATPTSPGSEPVRATGSHRGPAKVTWQPRDTLWGFIGGLLLALIVPPLLVLPFDPALDSDGALLSVQGLFDLTLILIAVGYGSGWRFRDLGDALSRLGLRGFRLSGFGWMLLMLFTYYVGAAIFGALVVQPDQEDIGKELGVCNPGLGIVIFALLSIVVIAPVTEELFFRGFMFGGMRARWSLWPAALVSGVVFGLVHAPTGPTAAIPLAGLGVGLAWLYDKTGSIWPSITAHFLNNSLAILVVLLDC